MTFFDRLVTSRDVLMRRSRRSLCSSISSRKPPKASSICALVDAAEEEEAAELSSVGRVRSSDRLRLLGYGREGADGDAFLSLRSSAIAAVWVGSRCEAKISFANAPFESITSIVLINF